VLQTALFAAARNDGGGIATTFDALFALPPLDDAAADAHGGA
jgi:hypothetical protein